MKSVHVILMVLVGLHAAVAIVEVISPVIERSAKPGVPDRVRYVRHIQYGRLGELETSPRYQAQLMKPAVMNLPRSLSGGSTVDHTTSGTPVATAPEAPVVTSPEAQVVRATESSEVTGQEASEVSAQEAADITAPEASEVTAQEPSKVTAQEASEVTAQEPSKVTAQEPSKVTAQEPSKVTAQEASEVTAQEPSKVTAQEPSKVTAQEASEVTAPDTSAMESTVEDIYDGEEVIIIPDFTFYEYYDDADGTRRRRG